MTPPRSFLDVCANCGIAFDDGDLDLLERYLNLLLQTNTSFNLTAITDPEVAWMRHIFDSLTLLPYVAQSGAKRIIDIGSGGGLPGVPLAIVLPQVSITLLEATGKKAAFLREVIGRLGLSATVDVINGRAETAAHQKEHRERYDIVTARAVGPLNVLLELAVPFARVGGLVLAIKGERAREEVDASGGALHKLHAAVIDASGGRTPTGTIIAIEKRRPTPKIYPRRPGEPKRSPL